MYFDTPERELARARIAIRLRLEGRDWVLTLKMPGTDAITRIEMNHPRPGPVLDLSVYAGTDVEAPLAAIKGELGLRYETDVLRLLRRVRTRHGMVELAYDTGILRAGTLELPISELEFELVSGQAARHLRRGPGWQQRHALVLNPRSKSERGDALAQLAHKLARSTPPPAATIRRAAPRLSPGSGRRARGRDQAARGHEPAASHGRHRSRMPGPDRAQRRRAGRSGHRGVYRAGNSEHVHQLRVGVRRLRSAWKLFDGWIAPVPDAMLQQARAHFAAFGANRDQDVLNETVAPALARAGMPVIPVESTPPEDARTIAGGRASRPGCWTCWNGAWTCRRQRPRRTATRSPTARPRTPRPSRPSAWKAACPARWCSPPSSRCKARARSATTAKAAGAAAAPLARQSRRPGPAIRLAGHPRAPRAAQARQAAALQPGLRRIAAARRQAARLPQAAVARAGHPGRDQRPGRGQGTLACTATHPQAWFALGWISARLEELATEAQQAFDDLAHSKPFWKKAGVRLHTASRMKNGVRRRGKARSRS